MITLSRLIDVIRQIAATEPNFIYNGAVCSYTPNSRNRCGCIVGEALVLLGVPYEILTMLDADAARYIPTQWAATATKAVLAGLLTAEALDSEWVACVQRLQDSGQSWGDAIAHADLVGAANGWEIQ